MTFPYTPRAATATDFQQANACVRASAPSFMRSRRGVAGLLPFGVMMELPQRIDPPTVHAMTADAELLALLGVTTDEPWRWANAHGEARRAIYSAAMARASGIWRNSPELRARFDSAIDLSKWLHEQFAKA